MNYTEYYKHLMNEALGDVERIKWKQQVPTLTNNIINSYIEKFDTIRKTRPSAAQHDIDDFNIAKGNDRYDISKYNNWKDFEAFVDYVNGQIDLEKSKGKKFTDIKVDGKPLVEKNGLEIYYAMDKHACIRYKGDKPYSWCISRSDSSNMYNTYRYKYNEPSFYFVKDIEATQKEFEHGFDGTFKNPWHFFVIQKTKDGDYIVTNADNNGDATMSWNHILRIQPKLNGMEEYFVNVPLSDIEKQNYERFIDGLSDREFAKLNYKEKESYLDIAIPNNELTDFKFKSLPDDLKNKYIGFGIRITPGQYEIIKKNKSLLKRLTEISIRRFELYKQNQLYLWDLSDIDFKAIAASPNAARILQFKTDDDFFRFIKMFGADLDEVIKLLGLDTLTTLFKRYPQKAFELYDDLEITKQIVQILGEHMKFVSIKAPEGYSSSNYGPTYRNFYTDNVNNLISVIDLILKYRDKLSITECDYILRNHMYGFDTDDENTISNKIFELYKQGKIEHANEVPLGLNKEYVADLLAWILMTNKNPEKIFDYVDFSIWQHLTQNTLKMLFKSQNKIIHKKLAPIFKDSLKIGPLMYDFIMTVVRGDRNKILNFVQKMGGVENIRNRMPEYGISTILYNTPTINLPLIASLIPKKLIEKLTGYDIRSIIKSSLGEPNKFNDKSSNVRLPLLFKIIGATAITNAMKGSELYFLLSEVVKSYSPSVVDKNSIDNFCELIIKTKGNELESGKLLNEVEAILTFSNNIKRMFDLIDKEKIDNLNNESVYSLLKHSFFEKNFSKNIELLELLGANNVSKALEVFDASYNAYYDNSYDFFSSASRKPPLFEYLIKQLVASGRNMNSAIIGNIISCTMSVDLEKIGNILGAEKISLLSDHIIGYNMSKRSDKDSLITLLIKSFDKQKLIDLMITSVGKNWESQVSKQTYQMLTGVTEHLLYKNYYL